MKRDISVIVVVIIILAISFCHAKTESHSKEQSPTIAKTKTFDGQPRDLKQTQILLSLDTPIEQGMNAVWCASFLSAWKCLQNDVAGEPVELEGAKEYCDRLNNSPDPSPDLPENSSYATGGWVDKGIIETIYTDIKKMFPAKELPTFPGIVQSSFLAYAYLEANVPFTLPYFQNRKPLNFTDSNGKKTEVNSFGIRQEDDYAYHRLRNQVKILFANIPIDPNKDDKLEFAIDLCRNSSPSQIVIARIEPEQTLSATLTKIEKSIAKSTAKTDSLKKKDPHYQPPDERFGVNDVLLVPDMFWRITHHFSEFEGRSFKNDRLKGQRMDVALQEIVFRLDRSGAELQSEAKQYMLPMPTYFLLDRPFLIYMKKRGAKSPYFVMWVDNAELLQSWDIND